MWFDSDTVTGKYQICHNFYYCTSFKVNYLQNTGDNLNDLTVDTKCQIKLQLL